MLELSQFQQQLLVDVITKRQIAVENENEALKMVFASHNKPFPKTPISIKNGSLTWEEELEQKSSE